MTYLKRREFVARSGFSATWRQQERLWAAFFAESRMRCLCPTKLRRKSGGRPKAEGGMGNKEYFFTIDKVVPIVQFLRVIAREGAGQIGIAESYAFCLLPGEAA